MILSLITAVVLRPPSGNFADLLDVGLLLAGGTKAEKMIGAVSAAYVNERCPPTGDERVTARVQGLFNRLLNAPGVRRNGLDYSVTVLSSMQLNAFSVPGGHIFLFDGLMYAGRETDDELIAVMAHELGHANALHGYKQLRDGLILKAGANLLGTRSKDLGAIASTIVDFVNAKHSRQDELEADRLSFAYAVAAGADPSAPLAQMRRLETLETERPDWVTSQLATHPPAVERSANLKGLYFEQLYGSTALVAGDHLKVGTLKTFEPSSDPNADWVKDYQASTGRKVYHLTNYFAVGECTWLAQAIREEELPRGKAGSNNAAHWLEHCQSAGYAIGHDPKPGAIAVWNEKVGGGAGHVATVTDVLGQNFIGVWDANWSVDLDHKVRYRVIDVSKEKNLIGFIYWPHNQTEPPPNDPDPEPTPASSFTFLTDEYYLGASQGKAQTIWSHRFALTPAEVGQAGTAHVELELKAVPRKDPIISLNGHVIARIVAEVPEWKTYRTESFSTKILRPGQNLIDAETVILSLAANYDQCWIRNIRLVFDR